MKRLFLVLALLFAAALPAQAPVAVPLKEEPHHHLVLENEYVRVFRVSVPAHSATLLHQHDVPYLYISLGPADVINAVQGRPEARIVMADGQLGYSPGHFAHIARNESATPFNNVTIELMKPQGKPHNLCERVIDGPLDECKGDALGFSQAFGVDLLFETEELIANYQSLPMKVHVPDRPSTRAALLVACDKSDLSVDLPGQPATTLHIGEVQWFPAGSMPKITVLSNNGTARYLWLSFIDSYVPEKREEN